MMMIGIGIPISHATMPFMTLSFHCFRAVNAGAG